jgi:hypothetical protein
MHAELILQLSSTAAQQLHYNKMYPGINRFDASLALSVTTAAHAAPCCYHYTWIHCCCHNHLIPCILVLPAALAALQYKCNPWNGQCRESCPVENGTPCYNGLGSCQCGVCIPIPPKCPPDPDKCTKNVWNPNTNACDTVTTSCTQPTDPKYECKEVSAALNADPVCIVQIPLLIVSVHRHCTVSECIRDTALAFRLSILPALSMTLLTRECLHVMHCKPTF